jgi:diguanylate cyclase (GGDEF)-like protein
VALMVWLGPQPRQGLWRHPGFVSAAAIAWILASTAWRGHAALTRQFGQRTAWVVTGTLSAFAALQAVRVVHALTSTASVPMHQAHAANLTLVYSMLIAAAVLNMVHLFLMVLRLLRRLTDLVDRDALTGLLNRRAVEQALAQQWADWRRSGRPFAVISLDLDHFKQVNDRWGHSAGDEVLRATAAVLQRGVREVDLVARVGGEEFLILLPGHAAASARVSAERLRDQLAQAEISLPGGAALRVTCSAGVAEVGADDAAPEQLLQRADRALYQAKRDGRDRVVSAVPDGTVSVNVTVNVSLTEPTPSRA